MAIGRSQFIGAAGQYYVAYGLTSRQIHAAMTLGGVPGVDILAATADGKRSITVQVKTARNAARKSYGDQGYNWDVGDTAVGKFSESFWYALIDLKASEFDFDPDVYFVPSRWVGLFVERDFSRKIFFLNQLVADKIRNNWEFVRRYLEGDPDMVTWANSLDAEFRWWGTKDGYSSAEIEDCIKDGTKWNSDGSIINE